MINFTSADRVGAVGGYIGGIATLANMLGGVGNFANALSGGAVGTPAVAPANATPVVVQPCSENQPITRYELDMALRLNTKDNEIALLKADKYTDEKLVEVYTKLDKQGNDIRAEIRANKDEQAGINLNQAVYNGTNTAAIGCLQQSLAGLQAAFNSVTKLVIPNSNVCPGWGAVTIKPDTATTTTTT